MDQATRPGIGAFLIGLRQKFPGAKEQDLVSFYDELAASGGDESKVAEALMKLNTKGGAQQVEVVGKRPTGQQAINADTRIPKPVETPSELPSPLRGTTQALRDPQNPQASGLSQFDPEAMKAAQAEYNARQRQLQQGRGTANTILGFVSGFDNGASQTRNAAYYDQLDKELKDQTLGAQERLQAQATQGQAATTSQQNQDIAAGKFQMDKARAGVDLAAARADAIIKNLNAEQQQRMNTPGTPETMILRQMISASAATLPPQAKAAIGKLLAENPDASAMQLLPVIGQYAPALQKSYLDMLSGAQTQAGTRLTNAQANLAETGAGNAQAASTAAGLPGRAGNTNVVPPAVQGARDGERRQILMQELAAVRDKMAGGKENDPRLLADAAALLREIKALDGPTVNVPPMTVTGLGGDGVPQVQATPGYLESQAERTKIRQNYETTVGPAIAGALSMIDDTRTGAGTNAIARFWPSNKQQELITRLRQVENAMPGVLPPELKAMVPSGTGARALGGQFDQTLTQDQLKRLLSETQKSIEATINFDPKSAPKSFQQKGPSVVRMQDKSGKFYNIPASEVAEAKKDGLKEAQ